MAKHTAELTLEAVECFAKAKEVTHALVGVNYAPEAWGRDELSRGPLHPNGDSVYNQARNLTIKEQADVVMVGNVAATEFQKCIGDAPIFVAPVATGKRER